jgi:hypothetical protein
MKKRSAKAGKATAEPWEVERLHKEFPVKSEHDLEEALERCKEERPQSTEETTRCVQRKISK